MRKRELSKHYHRAWSYFSWLVILCLYLTSCIPESSEEENTSVDLIGVMAKNQRFLEKLFLAGQYQNWELADFYLHELEENKEELEEGHIVYDDYDISNLSGMLNMALSEVEKAIVEKDSVLLQGAFVMTVQSCNACHAATEHGFIKIKKPDVDNYSSQNFRP